MTMIDEVYEEKHLTCEIKFTAPRAFHPPQIHGNKK